MRPGGPRCKVAPLLPIIDDTAPKEIAQRRSRPNWETSKSAGYAPLLGTRAPHGWLLHIGRKGAQNATEPGGRLLVDTSIFGPPYIGRFLPNCNIFGARSPFPNAEAARVVYAKLPIETAGASDYRRAPKFGYPALSPAAFLADFTEII